MIQGVHCSHSRMVLSQFTRTHHSKPWLNILIIPVYAVVISLVLLLLQSIFSLFSTPKDNTTTPTASSNDATSSGTLLGRFRRHVHGLGGWVIFAWRVARLLALASLVGLSAYTVTLVRGDSEEQYSVKDPKWPHVGLVIVYVRFMDLRSHRNTHSAIGLLHFARPHDSRSEAIYSRKGGQAPLSSAYSRLWCICLSRRLALDDLRSPACRRGRGVAYLDKNWHPVFCRGHCSSRHTSPVHSV